MNLLELKSALYHECFQRVEERFQKIQQTLADLNESLESADSNSSEDEMDNSRAMMQLDRERILKQQGEVLSLKELLKKVDVKSTADYVRLGSLVLTNTNAYFICLSIGNVAVEGKNYTCIALNSPIGQALRGSKKDDVIQFNDQEQKILDVV